MTSINDNLDDATAEQLLAGRASTADLEPVAAAVRALREAATQPVQPSPALRAQMAAGAFDRTPADTYRAPGGSRLRGLAVPLVASVLRARLATKLAAAGVAAAVLSVGTAGFAGSLPPPMQDSFESVVESVSPYQFREKAGNPGGDTESPPGDAEDARPVDGVGESEPGGTDSTPSPTPAVKDKSKKDEKEKGKNKNKDKGNKDKGNKDKGNKDKGNKDKGNKDKGRGKAKAKKKDE